VLQICSDVWEGTDYIPEAFDGWVSDPSALFQAAELDGEVVGVHCLRLIAPGLAWYEGLRVASTHRRRGIASTMVAGAADEARSMGCREVRLATFDPEPRALFASVGFEVLVEYVNWRASRLEGGETAQIPRPRDVPRLLEIAQAEPTFAALRGVNGDVGGAADLDEAELARLATLGRLRAGAGGRALAAIRRSWGGTWLVATFLSGHGGVIHDLLLALRVEADADDLKGAMVMASPDFPAAPELEEAGYDWRFKTRPWAVYGLRLDPGS
jgi:GNAT superfamily N-acetyltransferase